MHMTETAGPALDVESQGPVHWRPVAERCRAILDAMPVAAYACDRSGLITYFNAIAAAVWGRTPKLCDANERYCGSHRLYLPDGTPVPREECWVARALIEGKAYDGYGVVIEREDRTRVIAKAHVHPLRNAQGRIVGALNLVADVTALSDPHARGATPDPRFGYAVARAVIDTTVAVFTSMNWEKPTFD
jgi:PAS domain-containing protein